MIWIQLLGAIFALDMMFVTYYYHRRGVFYLHDSIIWMTLWSGIFLTAVFPNTVEVIVEPLQIMRVMDFLQLAGFFLIFSMLFMVFLRSRHNDKRIEELVRELALRDAEEK
jgi:hypothetical protein